MLTPIAIATSTCTYRIEYQRRRCSAMDLRGAGAAWRSRRGGRRPLNYRPSAEHSHLHHRVLRCQLLHQALGRRQRHSQGDYAKHRHLRSRDCAGVWRRVGRGQGGEPRRRLIRPGASRVAPCVPPAMPAELPQRPLPIGMGPGLVRCISSTAWSDRVLASLGIDVLRLGRLLPVTYSLSSLSRGFPSSLSAPAHATSDETIIVPLRIVFTMDHPHSSSLTPPGD